MPPAAAWPTAAGSACRLWDATPLQASSAAWNWGELGSPSNSMCPLLSGSGNSGTPFLRMQAENAAGFSDREPSALGGSAPVVVVSVVSTCATPSADEPPQAEASSASAAAAVSNSVRSPARASRDRPSLAWLGRRDSIAMSSPSQIADRWSEPVVRPRRLHDGYRLRSGLVGLRPCARELDANREQRARFLSLKIRMRTTASGFVPRRR
jgi:hypothetical protein